MRPTSRMIFAYRALFGAGFVVLGLVTLWRVALVRVPMTNKMLGMVLALAMIALGVARIVQYLRARERSP